MTLNKKTRHKHQADFWNNFPLISPSDEDIVIRDGVPGKSEVRIQVSYYLV